MRLLTTRLAVLGTVLGVGCGGGGVADTGAPDAARIDAAGDIAASDARADGAPSSDAPALDAPALDAPAMDAPTADAPAMDTPIVPDVPPTDAPTTDTRRPDAATLVWQTTFPDSTCPYWNQTMGLGDDVVCARGDGLAGHGAWTTPGHPMGDEITAAANNPSGGGGKGFRHWRCDGMNCNGGGIQIELPTGLTDMWLRFYMRYETGFNWSPAGSPGYTKDIYMLGNTASDYTLGFHGGNSWGLYTIGIAGTPFTGTYFLGSPGWQGINGGLTGDGRFHCYEAHHRLAVRGNDGVVEIWVDGARTFSTTTANLTTSGVWRWLMVGENQNNVSNGVERYTDYDDFAVSTAGPIGCL